MDSLDAMMDASRQILELSKNLGNVELSGLANALMESAMEVESELLIHRKAVAKIGGLGEALDELEYREGAYWWYSNPGERPTGPYCPMCFDNDEKLILMSIIQQHDVTEGRKFHCSRCKGSFGNSG